MPLGRALLPGGSALRSLALAKDRAARCASPITIRLIMAAVLERAAVFV